LLEGGASKPQPASRVFSCKIGDLETMHSPRDDSDQRFKLFRVAQFRLLAMLNQVSIPTWDGMFLFPVIENLPAGYRVRTVFNDQRCQDLVFVVCHPSWPIVAEDASLNSPEEIDVNWGMIRVTGVECK
jgi:hypothetical protein